MNKTQKMLVSISILAMMAFSAAAMIPTQALVTANTLTIKGSSTVYPIAQLEAQTFPAYWNNLVANNPSWGTAATLDINSVNLEGFGSGTAIPAILPTTGNPTADIGEMSRPPSAGEWTQSNAGNLQVWAVGIDSIAIVYSSDMTWAPTQLSAVQVAQLFESTDAAGNSPIYTTWGQFLTAYYGALGQQIPAAAQAHMNDPIHRLVRDPTSGTYDCFNNFFGKQLGNNAEVTNSQGAITGSQYMAPYTLCEANQDIVNNINGATDTIGFLSLGYYTKNTSIMIPISLKNGSNYYLPSQANVIAGTYTPFRWLWEVTPSTIPSTGPGLALGVWIAYMKLDPGTVTINGGTTESFVTANDYMPIPRAAMAGGQVVNSALAPQTTTSGQTQTVPRLTVDGQDFFYFVDAYIAYYANGIYNPYADITAQGTINGASFFAFVSDYIAYYTTYNPT